MVCCITRKRQVKTHPINILKTASWRVEKNKGRRLIIHKGPAQDDDKETADEKRLRLAQEYLEKLGAVEAEDKPDADLIAERLDQDEVSNFNIIF